MKDSIKVTSETVVSCAKIVLFSAVYLGFIALSLGLSGMA